MIRTVQRELSATSNVNAPKFNFREYVRGQVYKNNSTDIDFVTDNGNLYVPVSDNVTANKNLAKEDNNFMLLVAKGEQGEQGVKGEKGADGRTPAVYARFDGKQMVFYTNVLDEDGNIVYNDNGTPATRRMAATNDLTGPSWKPELVNDTIVWHKTKEDEAPKSIPLSSLIKQTAPVLLRVDSDNTRRMDEMDESGPANYIQWKYEGDEHWNNLISISELMNLTLAGVSIWYDEEDGHYHFGHKEVEKASYAASHTGKQIITAVELGEILYDAGPIPLEDWSAQIAALHDYICQVEEKIPTDYVKSVENILPDENGNVDLPNYVKTVNNQVPDNNGNVQIELPNLDGYLKATDLRFKVQNDSDGRFLYFSTRRGEEGTWQKVLEATCSCSVGTRWTVTFGTPNPANAEMVCNDRIVRPGDTMQVRDGDVICITATAENYQRFYECYTITSNRTFAPQLTPVVSTYCARVNVTNDPNNEGHIYMKVGTTEEETTELCGLSNGTTVIVRGTRPGYNGFGNHKIVINNADVTWDYTWTRSTTYTVTPSTESDCSIKPDHLYISKTEGSNWTESPLSGFISGATVYVKAVKDGKKPKEWHQNVGANITVKLDSEHSGCDWEDEVETYTVNTDKNSGSCDVKPEAIYLSLREGDFSEQRTSISNLTGTNTIFAQAVKSGKEPITKSIQVTGSKTIKFSDITSGCPWDEVTPPTYTVGVRNNSSCPADTMYLSLDEHDFEDHNTTLSVPSGTVVYMQAAKEGYNYQTISHEITEDNYKFTPTCDWEWGGEFEVNGGNDISINVGECVNLSELITYTPSNYVPQSIAFEKGEDSYSDAISLNTETGEVCGLSETSRPASVKVTINDKHLVWVNVWVGGGTHLYQLKVMEESTPGQPMPSNPDIKVYIDGVAHTYTDHALSFNVAEGTPITVTASKEGWTANINNEDRSEYSFNMPDEDQYVIIAWTQNKYTLSVTSNTPSGAGNPKIIINGVTYSDVSTTVQRQIGHGDSANITATLGGYTPTYKDHNTGTTITIPFTMIKNTWVDIDWSADTISVTGVSLNKNTMALTYASCDGNTYGNTTETLDATIYPSNASNKGVSWSSNNTSVATVNTNGDVTAKSVGSATITATSKGNTSKKATCVVTVTAATVPTSTISLNKQSTTLTVDETEVLTVTRTPSCASDTINWSSNNTTVATVSNGTITAKAAGNATITAKVGTNGPTATCAITVNTAIVPVTSVVMNCHEGSIVVGDRITLSATVYPENATDKTITWVQGQNPKGTIEGNIFTATDTGTELISAQAGGVSSEQCGIVIDPRPVSVEGISINNCPGTIAQGLTNVTLTATISPIDATNKNVTWSTSDNTVVDVEKDSNGNGHLIVKHKAGTAIIKVKTEDGNFEDSCAIVVPSTAIEFALGNQTSSGNKIYYTIGDNIDENEWSETWDSLNYGATTGTNPPLTISPGESLCITSENYPEDIQLEVNGTNRDDTNGFITMTYSELQQAAGYSNTYIVTFVREH